MPIVLKRKQSIEASLLPIRVEKRRRLDSESVPSRIWNYLTSMFFEPPPSPTPSPSSQSSSSRRSRSADERRQSPPRRRRRSTSDTAHGPPRPLPTSDNAQNAERLQYPPAPASPFQRCAPPLSEKPTEIIDLTGETPEPAAETKPATVLTSDQPPLPKLRVVSARHWRSIEEVEKDQAGSSSTDSSTASLSSDSTSHFSFTGTNKPLQVNPAYPLITDLGVRAPPGIRTANAPGLSPALSHRRRRYQERDHIFARQHKIKVAKLRKDLKNLQDQIYATQQRRGYKGTKHDFGEIFSYASSVREVVPEAANVPEFVWEEGYWEEIRKQANEAPLPIPYTPALEDLDKRIRDQNRRLDELRSRPRLPDSLSAKDEQQVDKLLDARGLISKCAREQVSDQDISRLKPAQWLNDEIINFYGAMINARAEDKALLKQGKVKNAFYLSTFFWEKLVRDGYERGRLAKWTKKVDIFSKDVVLIPVNHQNRHWTAAAINFRRKRIESYDSLNIAGVDVCKRLRQYIEQEHLNKKRKPFDWTGWEDFIDRDHPQQENGYDCGVFTCQTLESISRGEETRNFTQGNMPYLRRKMIWEIGNVCLRDEA